MKRLLFFIAFFCLFSGLVFGQWKGVITKKTTTDSSSLVIHFKVMNGNKQVGEHSRAFNANFWMLI